MEKLKLSVVTNEISITEHKSIVSGTHGDTMSVTFSDGWDEYLIRAVWQYQLTEPFETVANADGTYNIPAEPGEYKYADISEADLSYFRPALAYLLNSIKTKHPTAALVFILNHAITDSFKESAKTICNHMGVPCIELSGIAMTGGHPNTAGMVTLSNQVINFMDKLSV